MEDKIVFKFINKLKDKLSKNKTTYPSFDEYAFSTEEIRTISEQNNQKIQELKQDIFSKKKKTEPNKVQIEEINSPVESNPRNKNNLMKEQLEESQQPLKKEQPIELKNKENNFCPEEHLTEGTVLNEISDPTPSLRKEQNPELSPNPELQSESPKDEPNVLDSDDLPKEPPKNSFVNLNEEYQKIVMNKWNEIDYKQLDKDIIEGKDLLNHNYTITYADDAAKFIHNIRKQYEVVICYLIGFNNEKKGLYEKTIFSDKIDEEWKYLSNYIKVLEKIRSFRK